MTDLQTILISRTFLAQVLEPFASLGTAWSGDTQEFLIAESRLGNIEVRVYLAQVDAQHWTITIRTTPPLHGFVDLSSSDRVYRAMLDSDGQADFAGLPTDMLTATAESDLVIALTERKAEA